MPALHEIVERKFIESYEVEDWEILTDQGFSDVSLSHKTIPYGVWEVITTNHSLKCADTHIVFDENLNEVFMKDLVPNQSVIYTDSGLELVQKIICHGYEDNMFDITVNDDNHRFYTNGILSHNSITTAAFILWYAFFNADKNIAILANKAATARGILARIVAAYERIPFFLQPGCRTLNKGSLVLGNSSTIIASATSGSAIRGESCNLLYLDEFAFVENDVEFFKAVFPTISSGGTAKVIISSTPNGLNLFHKLWKDSKESKNDFTPFEISWHQVPGRDEEWKRRQVEVLQEHGFRQEYGNEFLGSSNTLISGHVLQSLVWDTPIKDEDSYTINEEPIEGNSYVISVDSSRGVEADYSVATVINVSKFPYKISCVFRNNAIRPLLLSNVIVSLAKKYNNAILLVERNTIGQVVVESCYHDLEYENIFSTIQGKRGQTLSMSFGKAAKSGVEMTSAVKRIGSSTLKTLIEENKITSLTSEIVNELYTFINKSGSWAAEGGKHDDLVMTLVLFSWAITQPYFKEMSNSDLRKSLMETGIIDNEEIFTFAGINNGINNKAEDSWTIWR